MKVERRDGESVFADPEEWDRLATQHGSAFYQSRRWCEPWWRVLVEGAPIGSLRGRDTSGGLVGHWSLTDARLPTFGRVAPRVRAVIPTGTYLGSADHTDVLASPEAHSAFTQHASGWTGTWAPRRPVLLPALPEASGFERGSVTESLQCPRAVIEPGAGWDAVTRTWSKNRRKKLRLKRDAFAAAGGTFEWFDSSEAVEQRLDTVLDLHRARWKALGRRTQFGWDPTRRRFIEAVVRASGAGSVWVQMAELQGRTVGALLGFELAGTVHVYQSGWDPAASELSVGLVQYCEAYRRTVDAAGRCFDMCRGTDSYKLRFATEVVTERSWLEPHGLTGAVLRRALHTSEVADTTEEEDDVG